MGRHGGLWFYWPRSDKVSVATTCSLQWRESSGILRQACLDVGMFSSVYHTASARPASWGALTDLQQEPTMTAMYFWAFMYCLICFSPPHGIELLMRDDWQAGGGGGISFQRFTVTRSGLASPLPPQTLLLFGSTQGNYSLCLAFCMLPGRWSCLSACLKCAGIGCTLEKHRLSLFWSNATTYTKIQNFILDGRRRAGRRHSRCRRAFHLDTRSTLIDTVLNDSVWPPDDEQKSPPYPEKPPHPRQCKAVGCEVVKQAVILYWILTFINHTCLWVNSQLHRFNKRHAGRPRHSVRLIYTSVREIIMEILRGRWTLITAQNKSRGDMKIDRRFSPSRLQVECGIETTESVRTSQVILLLEGDFDYAG